MAIRIEMAVTSNPVVSRKDAKEFARHIIEQGYKKTRVAGGFDKAYQSEVEIYVKDVNGARVSVDLFVNGMTSRGTKGS